MSPSCAACAEMPSPAIFHRDGIARRPRSRTPDAMAMLATGWVANHCPGDANVAIRAAMLTVEPKRSFDRRSSGPWLSPVLVSGIRGSDRFVAAPGSWRAGRALDGARIPKLPGRLQRPDRSRVPHAGTPLGSLWRQRASVLWRWRGSCSPRRCRGRSPRAQPELVPLKGAAVPQTRCPPCIGGRGEPLRHRGPALARSRGSTHLICTGAKARHTERQ